MKDRTIYWYDYETFGADPRRDRVAQFAGLRTDESLQLLGEPLVLYCRPANDFLPSPTACLITGITPRVALEQGVHEADFIRAVLAQLSVPGTCAAGYNSLRFDDEFTRRLLYRNFHDPYEREWKDGNSRWDILDMMRLCAAVRPDGIAWPRNEEGVPSFRLEDLTAANGIAHANAHDALADVYATIDLARLVMRRQPRLFDFVYQLRDKHKVEEQIDLAGHRPLVHVSGRYPASLGCLALVVPLCRHPTDKNGVVVYDLREDPDAWLSAGPEEIRRLVFSRTEDLQEGERRIPLKTLHVNRCPVVAPRSILQDVDLARFDIDLRRCERHWSRLLAVRDLIPRVRLALDGGYGAPETDPDFMIYSGGFFSDGDRKLMAVVRESSPDQLAMLNLPFRDHRLPQMLFRYRARNFPATLDEQERQRWDEFRLGRLREPHEAEAFYRELDALQHDSLAPDKASLLAELRDYAGEVLSPSGQ